MNIFYKENAHKWEEDFLFNDISMQVGCPATSGILALNIVGSEVGLGIARSPGEVCPGEAFSE